MHYDILQHITCCIIIILNYLTAFTEYIRVMLLKIKCRLSWQNT